MDCKHKAFYEDYDDIYRCVYCSKIIDPQEVEYALEEAKDCYE